MSLSHLIKLHFNKDIMKKISIFILFAICFHLCSFTLIHAQTRYSWYYPLEIKAGLSSNFGEFRGDRVHTGIDLRTNGQNGYKVYAIDDGVITRLAVQKYGFGNALYIEHPNGLMSVYGHLERFENKTLGLQTLVRQQQQQRNNKYPGNIYLKKTVKRGQLIAYSGESGYGLPHLHFEVRRGGDAPIDPFEYGFTYNDTTPPVIESLMIEPIGSQSFLEGEHFLRQYSAQNEQGKYVFAHTPRISGKVRFTAATYDQIGAENRCGVDALTLTINGEKFFTNQFDQVTYNSNQRGGLVYDYNWTRLSNPSQYFYRFYNLSPAHYPYRKVFAKNQGIWDTSNIAPGLHQLTLEIADAMGNVSQAAMQVQVEAAPSSPATSAQAAQEWFFEIREFQGFLEVVCQTTHALKALPSLGVIKNNQSLASVPLQASGIQTFSATYNLKPELAGMLELRVTAITQSGQQLEERRQVPVNPISASRGGTVSYGQKALMTFPAGALYEDIFANIFPTTAYQATEGLPLVSEVYDFRPAGCPLEKKGSIRIQYPAEVKDVKKLGIYWWDAIKQRWYFMDDRVEAKTRNLSADIIYPSIYAILQDTLYPVISDLRPEHNATVSAKAMTELSAIIHDVGKGVDENSIVMSLDGRPVAGEYDPDRDKFSFSLTKSLSAGKHTLTVQAKDKAGNPAKTRTAKFVVK
ncbi:peptidase family M23 [Candidatus Vecturithrix granuli]|uniref:Peptidase family M23 n=1 Tax=Vecturithrix granuli TaxID=1499967 RepID=A0A081BUJ0_VECG1|nr:peptidase family M23 [Candidatus Vecturithrix granuli]